MSHTSKSNQLTSYSQTQRQKKVMLHKISLALRAIYIFDSVPSSRRIQRKILPLLEKTTKYPSNPTFLHRYSEKGYWITYIIIHLVKKHLNYTLFVILSTLR